MPRGRGAYYEDLAGRLYVLLITPDGRLGWEQAQLLHHFIEVSEHGLALARQMKMNDLVPRTLGFCPRAR
jgi:hypothetical protein